MKFTRTNLVGVVAVAATAYATPVRRAENSTTVSATPYLQLALTLEHLENAFYSEGLTRFDDAAFASAGYAPWVRGRYEQIANHEAAHATLLTQTLGSDSVAPCNYSFPYNDPRSFVELSSILENVGNSAYLGTLRFLANYTEALEAAGQILSVEGRQASWIQSSVMLQQPWSYSYDTPINGNSSYTLASQFITQCPSSNPSLPFTARPQLNITNASNNSTALSPGGTVSISYPNATASTNGTYLALLFDRNTTHINITNNQATLPSTLQGMVYAFVTSNGSELRDRSILAGPAPLMFNFNASVPNY